MLANFLNLDVIGNKMLVLLLSKHELLVVCSVAMIDSRVLTHRHNASDSVPIIVINCSGASVQVSMEISLLMNG